MDPIIIHATEATPHIHFDSTKGVMEIKGVSYEEDAHAFYQPLLKWLEAYKNQPLPDTVLNVYFKYFNTATSKALYEVFLKLQEVKKLGGEVTIHWYYDAGDDDMRDDIEYFSEVTDIQINILELEHSMI
jgi:hypothetical protein